MPPPRDTVLDESVLDETVLDETVLDDTVLDESVLDVPAVIDLRDRAPADTSPIPPAAPAADDPASAEERAHLRLRIAAVLALVVLNAFDLITTRAFMRAGVPEGNPIAAAGLEAGWVAPFKFAALALLLVGVARRPPRIGSTALLWFVTGLYAMVVCVNLMIVREVGGSLF